MKSKILITLLVLMFSHPCWSAIYCAHDTASLRSALTAAANNFESDTIKIETGIYLTNGLEFSYHDTWGDDLELSGGWTTHQNVPCGKQSGLTDIFSTVLNAQQSSRVMYISLNDYLDLKISGLAFINGQSSSGAAGLEVRGSNIDIARDIIIENNVFINNNLQNTSPSLSASALSAEGGSTLIVRNNLFTENTGVAPTIWLDNSGEGASYYFLNNTVYGNSSGVKVKNQDMFKHGMWLANNVLQNNNTGVSLEATGGGVLRFSNNNLDGYISQNQVVESGNFNLPSRFEQGIYSFTPSEISPLVDSGLNSVGGVDLGNYALANEVRIQSLRPDVGAFESSYVSDLIFMNSFE